MELKDESNATVLRRKRRPVEAEVRIPLVYRHLKKVEAFAFDIATDDRLTDGHPNKGYKNLYGMLCRYLGRRLEERSNEDRVGIRSRYAAPAPSGGHRRSGSKERKDRPRRSSASGSRSRSTTSAVFAERSAPATSSRPGRCRNGRHSKWSHDVKGKLRSRSRSHSSAASEHSRDRKHMHRRRDRSSACSSGRGRDRHRGDRRDKRSGSRNGKSYKHLP